MKHSRLKRVLALVLVAALICGMNLSSAYAVEAASTPVTFQELDPSQVSAELVNTQGDTVQLDSAEPYEATELVRAMIVLEQDSTLTVMQASGEALTSQAAVQYRQKLDRAQEQMASRDLLPVPGRGAPGRGLEPDPVCQRHFCQRGLWQAGGNPSGARCEGRVSGDPV